MGRAFICCGPFGRSRDPGDNRRSPRILPPPRPQRLRAQSRDGLRSCASSPRRRGSKQSRCPLGDGPLAPRVDTYSRAIHPRLRLEPQRSLSHARLPRGQLGSLRSSVPHRRCDLGCLRARFVPAPRAPLPLAHRAVCIDVLWSPRRSRRKLIHWRIDWRTSDPTVWSAATKSTKAPDFRGLSMRLNGVEPSRPVRGTRPSTTMGGPFSMAFEVARRS